MSNSSARLAYLRPKLNPPRLSDDILVRERLLARIGYGNALTLVVAPAGYGKTTLAATWLARALWPGAWLTLDSSDNNLAVFLTGVVVAIRDVFPAFGGEVLELVSAPVELTAEVVLPPLLNALHRLDRAFALVLDDYHTITNQEAHQVLTGIAAYPPAALHLLLCTRQDPPLPLRIRLSGMVNEMRMQELSFTQPETLEFLERAATYPLDQAIVPALTQQVEGWPAALRLVAIMARQGRDISRVDEAVRASGRQLMDYLAAEVINTLTPELQRFVESTSILQRLCGPLCATVAGIPGEQATATLRLLEQAGLFLVNIDEAGDWYRYHALFRTLMRDRLRRRLGADKIEELHRRAAAWHETHGMLDDALQHLLSIADKTEAIALLARHRHQFLLQSDFRRLERWVSLFAPDAVQASPDLLLVHAWLGNFYYDLDSLASYVRRAEELADRTADSARRDAWRGEAKALAAIHCIFVQDAHGAIDAAGHALSLLGSELFYPRGVAGVALCIGLQMTGRARDLAGYLVSLPSDPALPHDLSQLLWRQLSGYVHYLNGDLPELRSAGLELSKVAASRAMTANEGWGHYFAGSACYLQNDLAGAYEQFSFLLDARFRIVALPAAHGAFGLALTFQALDLPLQANAVLESAQHYLDLLRSRELFNASQALAAELALRQGGLEDAVRWRRQSAHLVADSSTFLYCAQLAAPKILLAEDTPASRQEAVGLLRKLDAQMRERHNLRFLTEVLVLQAVLAQREDDAVTADAALEEALGLAAPGGHLRPFVDYAAALRPLLDAYQPPAHLQPFAVRVRSTLEFAVASPPQVVLSAEAAIAFARPLAAQPTALPKLDDGRDLREVLTFREMDVLLLLGRRMTNKEIAQVLNVSVDTVKQHTVSLYRKLGVENRRQASLYADQIDPSYQL